jgi:predicted CXXCH cytochrome family protein
MRTSLTRRAGPLFGLWLVVVGLVLTFSPVIPAAWAIDPTPEPSALADPSPSVEPSFDPGPSADPTTPPDPTPDPPPDPSAAPTAEPTPDPSAEPSAEPSAAPSEEPGRGVKVTHFWIDKENDLGTVDAADAGVMDDARIGVERFHPYRVRFQVLNDGPDDVRFRPQLLWGAGLVPTDWLPIAEVDPAEGVPFYAASDKGPTWEVRTHPIKSDSLREAAGSERADRAVDGMFSAGVNPAPAIDLPAGTYTEIEFLVRATIDAELSTAYAFRLASGDIAAQAQVDAPIAMEAYQPVKLSPGATAGEPVEDPEGAAGDTPVGSAMVLGRLSVFRPAEDAGSTLEAGAYVSPHTIDPASLNSDMCAACHTTHTAQALMLFPESTQSALCFSCHDGTGSDANVLAQYTRPGLPANNDATRSYYSHPATAASNHVLDDEADMAGRSNRHAQCADCHQPHRADDTAPVQTINGWEVGGPILGASGVAVTNGAANTVPTFTWTAEPEYEYQLCFKCHTGFTQLLDNTGRPPSQQVLDKSVELNPANLAYHPVEAAGKNTGYWMDRSLSGLAPGKLWQFTTSSTVRCTHCHASGVNTTTPAPAADGVIDPHASVNRGVLLRNYRDRLLKSGAAAYTNTDFRLCYLCHAEGPMLDEQGNRRQDTAFQYHGLHTSGIGSGVGSTQPSIDTAGAGTGEAVCAECHFRIHGSTYPGNTNAEPESRLVNFAPNIQGPIVNGTEQPIGFSSYVPAVRDGNGNIIQPAQNGTCTLVCHGESHSNEGYTGPAATPAP